ncbi:MAG: hypothetical protein QOG38_3059 [Hyphomicrobiales bacterium]|nr:hypothetical protein [Hyphomicrobiales bacterium]
MYLILLAIGVFVATIGVALIRYGVPLDEYGNSPLLVSGMVALVGGLIVISLSLVVRTLKRISERLDIQPMPLPPIADIAHAVPPPRPTAAPPAVKPEPVAEAAAPELRTESRVEPSAAPPQAAPPARTPAVPAPAKPSLLGGLFGKSKKAVAVGGQDTETPGDPNRVDLAPLNPGPERDATPKSLSVGNGAAPPRAEPAASASVYKSGVIDGMAYTLYVDGSIEAELPQGKIRFASVEALQTYLTSRSA